MTETRPHAPYAGVPRYHYLQNGQRVHRGQRWFLAPAEHLTAKPVVWMRSDQAWAVLEEGFFVERVQPLNTARLVSLSLFASKPYETEAALSSRLLQKLFNNPTDKRLQRLFTFVEQQDRYGWAGTWEVPSIEVARGPRQMRWLAAWYNDTRRGHHPPVGEAEQAIRQRVYDHIRADMARAGRDDLGLKTRELRRIFTPGCPCTYCKATERKRLAEAA